MKIVLASGNRNKYREMKDAFEPIGIELLYGGDFETVLDVDETGKSYEENAMLKASAWSKALGMPALADDSGLEVLALEGAPGINSARVVQGSDQDRTNWLISKMANIKDRRASFVSCITVVFPDMEEALVYEARCSGTIAPEPAGNGGFGYDPIFIPDGYVKTFSELGDNLKRKISHRALAIKGIAKMLINVLEYYAVRTMENSRPVQKK